MLVLSFALCYLLPLLSVRSSFLLYSCQCFRSSSINVDAFIVDEPSRHNFQKNLKVAQFPPEYLLLMDFFFIFFFFDSRLRVGVLYGKVKPPCASGFLSLSRNSFTAYT